MFFFYPKLRQLHRTLTLGLQDELFCFCFRCEKPSAAFPVPLTILQISKPDNIPLPYTSALPYPASMLLFFKVFVADLSLLTTFANTCLTLFSDSLGRSPSAFISWFPGETGLENKKWVEWDSNPQPTP